MQFIISYLWTQLSFRLVKYMMLYLVSSRWFLNQYCWLLKINALTHVQSKVKKLMEKVMIILLSLFHFLSALYLFIYTGGAVLGLSSPNGETNATIHPFIADGILVMLINNLSFYFIAGIIFFAAGVSVDIFISLQHFAYGLLYFIPNPTFNFWPAKCRYAYLTALVILLFVNSMPLSDSTTPFRIEIKLFSFILLAFIGLTHFFAISIREIFRE